MSSILNHPAKWSDVVCVCRSRQRRPLKNIKPGVSDNGLTQVDGINPGDVLADSSFDKLQDNSKVTVAPGKPGPGGPQKQGSPDKQDNQKQGGGQKQHGSQGT